MRTLTSKKVKEGIKNGLTIDGFCKKYDIKDENDFLLQLEKAFPKAGADQALRDIRKNEKLAHKATVKAVAIDVVTDTVTDTATDTVADVVTTPGKEGDKVQTLENLKSTEANLSSEVMNLENQHKELAGKRRECLQKLRTVQQKVDELVAELETQQSVYEETATKANEIIKQMNQVSSIRAEKLTELNTVREQIVKLETTIIAVYEDCSFELVDGLQISLETEDGEVVEMFHYLMEEEICEDLTVKQIKTLSKLLSITSHYPDQKLEFIFDSNSLEQAYLASKPLFSL